jgi:hypothetical protein
MDINIHHLGRENEHLLPLCLAAEHAELLTMETVAGKAKKAEAKGS